jgi:hypothetical protein
MNPVAAARVSLKSLRMEDINPVSLNVEQETEE